MGAIQWSNRSSPILHALSAFASLAPHELDLIAEQVLFTRFDAPLTELHAAGDSANQRILLSGWACRQRMLPDGRRQIINLIVPGDIIGPRQRPAIPAASATVALTDVETSDASNLLAAAEQQDYPGLRKALHAAAALEEFFSREQIVRLGRQTAHERMVHLMLELRLRLAAAGLGSADSFPMPLTQEVIADVLGVSAVHANRTLQQVRREGLLELRRGRVRILQPELMESIANWTLTTTGTNTPQPVSDWQG